ncbi:MAG: DUF3579 domain-containing protein [Thiobacillus sp.]|nr:DUF3579 domain-containing protein [Thiobacillus sp.]
MKAVSEQVVADCMANHSCNAVLILGVTRSGNAFRPGDWVDRLAGGFSTFDKDKLLKYSPSVRPLTVEGVRGLLIDIRLVENDPAAFRFVMDFAADNDLTFQCLGVAARDDSGRDGIVILRDGSKTN